MDLKNPNPSSDEDDNQSQEYIHNQGVVYDPVANQAPRRTPFRSKDVLPTVGAFTVQCALCMKWRRIPTKDKYEEIRERMVIDPFVCEDANEWGSDVTCDDEPDILQDESSLWAIDKPGIVRPPPGWQRLLRLRGEGASRFADVYYVTPSGKTLRSTVEIQRYLLEHNMEGVNMSQFSFTTPKPLVKGKRTSCPENGESTEEARPIAYAYPGESKEMPFSEPPQKVPRM